MSQDSDKMKRLVSFKKKLETQIEALRSELEDLETTLETVNTVLLEKGFKRVEINKQPTQAEPAKALQDEQTISEPHLEEIQKQMERSLPLKTSSGELLAHFLIGENSLRMVPAEGKEYDVKTPPFTQFLVERVLSRMQERDNELVRTGQLASESIFSYNIVQDGDIIREIEIKNFGEERLKELKSSMRWTLEKMCEKMAGRTSSA